MKRLSIAALFILLIATIAPRADAAEGAAGCGTGLLEGKRITVEAEGDGPDVVLIPGLSSPRAVWAPTAERLKATHRLHLVEVRGFGGDAPGPNAEGPILEPMMREIADYIDDCIVDQGRPAPAIIGHSLGGLTAMMIAARAPKEVGRLMVVDSLPFFGMLFGSTATVAGVEPQAAAMQKMLAARDSAEADDRTLQMMSATDAGRAQVKAWTRAANAKVAAQLMYDDMTTDLRPELGAIASPFTMLYPLDASVMPEAMVDGLYKGAFTAARTVKLKRIDGSRHFIMLDQPEAFAAAVDEFLAN
ncbi:alpha/beta fold hydrolase [Sphingopyxis terrae]|uniref:Pimeloyl-ACP methyl ester carboxylesterase n=1 Tax=Sphingopyxis terrae subsp. ummariensis TaxID=429001 RepID=A0A1Y6EFA7_9SPHN|nr:alpha/beta hydrolase [Sphingopyxis terrae]PCF93183.1 alpha/beta hydrolase [Sphingopyxis terrae subsp. ummariensis]SMQ61277.1 Pimeloyl-ACP methyl ester carboxylesterase [Sphingopyxis terrae subsp. ummariensis]